MNSTNKFCIVALMILLLGASLSGCCIREDNTDCPRPFRLFLKALDADEKDITESGEVKQVILFVFDENGQIVDAVTLSEEQVKSRKPIDIKLEYPGHPSLSFVAWGNTTGVDFPETTSVKEWKDLYAKLKSSSAKATTRVAESPSDLFYGDLTVVVEFGGIEPSGDQTVVIRRKSCQVTISAILLKQWNYGKEGTYTFVLRESPDSYDSKGNLTGAMVKYIPNATMNEKGVLQTPLFLTFPTEGGKSYVLDILFNGEVIYTAEKGTDGSPFVPEVGRLLNIIIDFGVGEDVTLIVKVTPWNVVYQYVTI